MLDKQKHAIEVLNDIVNILEDGKKGYKTAAEHIEDHDLRTMFNLYAQQRADFSAQIQNEIRELGGEPESNDDTKGKMHRVWLNLRAAVTGNDKDNVIAECERGETSAIEEYEEALKEDIPEFLKSKLVKQHDEIRNNLKMIRKIKDRD